MTIDFLSKAIHAALKAAEEILAVYEVEFAVEWKLDQTPVTLADKKANDCIAKELESTGIHFIGEESEHDSYEIRKHWKLFWLVDPLDGTKEFIKRNGEFTVNIGLVQDNYPIMGVIYSPVYKDLYFAMKGLGAYKIDRHKHLELGYLSDYSAVELLKYAQRLPIHDVQSNYTIVASRSHLNAETYARIEQIKRIKQTELINTGSSIKMCLVAEGRANEYPRFGPTMEWDTCAGQCIVEEAGGTFLNSITQQRLNYNKETLLNPSFICYSKGTAPLS